ncbi:hypothetical protein [Brachybacterium hainanense]|uniref:Uncharacterized protein n=1 Tax=Brachybacterium hainanense TaxID=1541174 RepID=A0ABV6REL2_9MICO
MSVLHRVREELARRNFAGRRVSLVEGAAVVAGSTLLLVVAGHRREALMIGGIGALGLVDDLVEPHRRREGGAAAKGLRGHLRALAAGEITTGALKAFGIPVIALAGTRSGPGPVGMRLLDGALVAGSANLVNLLDLRPGRALKAVLPLAGALVLIGPRAGEAGDARRTLAGAALLTGLAALPADLRERGMLGDAGANTLGALLGASAAQALPVPARFGTLGVVAGLTLASERISFSRVIESQPLLRRLDGLGRRPLPPADVSAP